MPRTKSAVPNVPVAARIPEPLYKAIDDERWNLRVEWSEIVAQAFNEWAEKRGIKPATDGAEKPATQDAEKPSAPDAKAALNAEHGKVANAPKPEPAKR